MRPTTDHALKRAVARFDNSHLGAPDQLIADFLLVMLDAGRAMSPTFHVGLSCDRDT